MDFNSYFFLYRYIIFDKNVAETIKNVTFGIKSL